MIYSFKETKLISTYLFAFAIGNFHSVYHKHPQKQIDLNIHCRKSLSNKLYLLDVQIVDLVCRGMEFYEQFFQFDFQFDKYEHVFCPEFNMGAMENPGLITMNENYLFYQSTQQMNVCKLMCILHELSHQWFGNLVTLEWWDDIWLNESFAEFIAQVCYQKLEYQGIIKKSYKDKIRAIKLDLSISTHPVYNEITDIEQSLSIFDAITYYKGCAIIQQIVNYIGEDGLQRSLYNYFQKFQWSNTNLQNFLDMIEPEFIKQNLDFSLDFYQKLWIKDQGINILQIEINENGFSILQKSNAPLKLRPHKLSVAYFGKQAQIIHTESIIISNVELSTFEFPELNQEILAILPNYDEKAYCIIESDELSFNYLCQNFQNIESLLVQKIVLQTFNLQANYGKKSTIKIFDFLLKNFQHFILQNDIDKAQDLKLCAQDIIFELIPLKEQQYYASLIFNMILEFIQNQDCKYNLQQKIFHLDTLLKFAEKKQDIEILLNLCYNQEFKSRYSIGLRVQWHVVQLALDNNEFTIQEKDEILNNQAKFDFQSEFYYKMKNLLMICKYNEEEKSQFFQKFLENQGSLYELQNDMTFFNSQHLEIKFQQLYFDSLIVIYEKFSLQYAQSLSQNLFPISNEFQFLFDNINKLLLRLQDDQTKLIKLKEFLMKKKEKLINQQNAYNAYYQHKNQTNF